MTNIAEGFGRFYTKDGIRFLDFSRSSCEEVKSLLYTAFDLHYITEKERAEAYAKAADTRNITLGFIKYLREYDSK